ncbi:hypothetical protein S40288_11668 [Stachybotrys chartarum IBT 40288]|nr:hypothetical protein S40288_11668 [Stachybotrys chartarum IBT 40288]
MDKKLSEALKKLLKLISKEAAKDIKAFCTEINALSVEERNCQLCETQNSLLTRQKELDVDIEIYSLVFSHYDSFNPNEEFKRLDEDRESSRRLGEDNESSRRLKILSLLDEIFSSEVVDRYKFRTKRRTYCNILQQIAKKIAKEGKGFEGAVNLLNFAIIHRINTPGKKNPPEEEGPITLSDLEWLVEGNWIPTQRRSKTKCWDSIPLCKLPSGYTTDQYGLIVPEGWNASDASQLVTTVSPQNTISFSTTSITVSTGPRGCPNSSSTTSSIQGTLLPPPTTSSRNDKSGHNTIATPQCSVKRKPSSDYHQPLKKRKKKSSRAIPLEVPSQAILPSSGDSHVPSRGEGSPAAPSPAADRATGIDENACITDAGTAGMADILREGASILLDAFGNLEAQSPVRRLFKENLAISFVKWLQDCCQSPAHHGHIPSNNNVHQSHREKSPTISIAENPSQTRDTSSMSSSNYRPTIEQTPRQEGTGTFPVGSSLSPPLQSLSEAGLFPQPRQPSHVATENIDTDTGDGNNQTLNVTSTPLAKSNLVSRPKRTFLTPEVSAPIPTSLEGVGEIFGKRNFPPSGANISQFHAQLDAALKKEPDSQVEKDLENIRQNGFVHWEADYVGTGIQHLGKYMWNPDGLELLRLILATPRLKKILREWFPSGHILTHYLWWSQGAIGGQPFHLMKDCGIPS